MPASSSRARWAGPPLIVLGGVIVVAGAIAIALLAGGGDDGDDAEPTPGENGAASDDFGEAPDLDGHVTAIFPEHAESVSQQATRPGSGDIPGAICVEVEFGDTDGVWYRMAVGGEEVTEDTVWAVPSREDPEDGRLCYDPAEGLDPGIVDAAVTVQDPNSNAPPSEVVSWRFEVTE